MFVGMRLAVFGGVFLTPQSGRLGSPCGVQVKDGKAHLAAAKKLHTGWQCVLFVGSLGLHGRLIAHVQVGSFQPLLPFKL
jgi:hypothetical protein